MMLSDQLGRILDDLRLAGVETTLMVGAIILLIGGLISKRVIIHKVLFMATLLVSLYLSISQTATGPILSESLFITVQSVSFTGLFILVLILVLIFPRDEKHSTEFYFFLLSLGAGASFMMKANSFLLIYLSIELVSFVSYILTSFSFRKHSHEAAIKYLLFGGLSSAVMLFGLGLIYGTTGTFYLSEWDFTTFDHLLSQAGLLFLILGILFKISIFPVQIWVPATYQSAPADATAIFSIIPKLAGLVLLKRVLEDASLINTHWMINLILLLGMLTILIGALGALRQSHTRRMISFGAIAHSGFLLPFAIISGNTGEEAFWWYSVAYAIMNLAVFYFLDRYESGGVEKNESYISTRKEVWIGAMFTLVLVSLTGLPPLAGFTAKFLLFSTLWQSYQLSGLSVYMVYLIIAVFATVASLFFYLRIPYHIFLSDRTDSQEVTVIQLPKPMKFIATIFAIALLLLFFVPRLTVMIHHLLNNVHE